MLTSAFKKALQLSVQAQSNGQQTVIFTKQDQPCYMTVLKAFRVEDVAPELGIIGVHPAFKVGDKVLDELLIGTYPSSLQKGEIVSQPFKEGTYPDGNARDPNQSWERSKIGLFKTILNQNAGNTEGVFAEINLRHFSALSLTLKSEPSYYDRLGYTPKSYTGKSPITAGGIRIDGTPNGKPDGNSVVIWTGTGDIDQRINSEYANVTDLYNFLWYFQGHNARIVYGTGGGEFQVFGTDSGSLHTMDTFTAATDNVGWYAFDKNTGALITPTHTGTKVGVDYIATTPNSLRIGTRPGDVNPVVANWVSSVPLSEVDDFMLSTVPQSVRNALRLHGVFEFVPSFPVTQTSSVTYQNPPTVNEAYTILKGNSGAYSRYSGPLNEANWGNHRLVYYKKPV